MPAADGQRRIRALAAMRGAPIVVPHEFRRGRAGHRDGQLPEPSALVRAKADQCPESAAAVRPDMARPAGARIT